MSQWQGMFLRGKHAWTCLLRILATWDFHATVAKGKEEALEPSQQSGFQKPGFWITMLGFRIPQTKITWIPDSGLPYMGRDCVHFVLQKSLVQNIISYIPCVCLSIQFLSCNKHLRIMIITDNSRNFSGCEAWPLTIPLQMKWWILWRLLICL